MTVPNPPAKLASANNSMNTARLPIAHAGFVRPRHLVHGVCSARRVRGDLFDRSCEPAVLGAADASCLEATGATSASASWCHSPPLHGAGVSNGGALRHLSQTPTTSAVVTTVASNPSVCVNTESTYSAGSPATASRGTTTW